MIAGVVAFFWVAWCLFCRVVVDGPVHCHNLAEDIQTLENVILLVLLTCGTFLSRGGHLCSIILL
jgi:hypothetical protein